MDKKDPPAGRQDSELELLEHHGRFPALKSRDFFIFLIAVTISGMGNQMQIVAVNWHIYLLTNSALSLGLIGLARFVPIVVFCLISGSVADTFNRKKVIQVVQVSSFIVASILAISTLLGSVNQIVLYVCTALLAITQSFDSPARQAFIPSMVPKDSLGNAMSLSSIGRQIATIVGPAIAGVLIAWSGVGSVYLINAFSFLALMVSLLFIRASGDIRGEPSSISLKSFIEGIEFVKSQTIIWSTMLLDFISTFFSSATTLLPIFARDILHVGPQGLGLLYSAQAIGALLAGFGVAWLGHINHQGRLLLISVGVYALATILFGFSTTFWFSFIALFLTGVGDSISTIIRNTIRQLTTPDSMRGRMTAINMIFFMGGPQLGEFEAGAVAAVIGGPWSVISGGILNLGAVVVMAWALPVLREFKGDVKEEKR